MQEVCMIRVWAKLVLYIFDNIVKYCPLAFAFIKDMSARWRKD